MNNRRGGGFTLVELVVVIAILGLITGLSGMALASLRPPTASHWLREAQRARAAAIRTGLPQRLRFDSSTAQSFRVLFLPDGRALGSGVDPLTGAPRAQ